eukprot:5638264-Pleurochrysis_carterae.AAC.1
MQHARDMLITSNLRQADERLQLEQRRSTLPPRMRSDLQSSRDASHGRPLLTCVQARVVHRKEVQRPWHPHARSSAGVQLPTLLARRMRTIANTGNRLRRNRRSNSVCTGRGGFEGSLLVARRGQSLLRVYELWEVDLFIAALRVLVVLAYTPCRWV